MVGKRIVQASWAGTILFAATAIPAALVLGPIRIVAVAVALGLFALGCAGFFWAYGLAIQRSRSDEIGIGGLFFLAGKETAPTAVKAWLLGSLGAQVLLAFTTATAKPYTTLAFGLLVPVYGLACSGLWAARHAHFGPRVAPQPRRQRGAAKGRSGAAKPTNVPKTQRIGQNARHG